MWLSVNYELAISRMFNPEIGTIVSLLFAQPLNTCEQSLLPKAYVFTLTSYQSIYLVPKLGLHILMVKYRVFFLNAT